MRLGSLSHVLTPMCLSTPLPVARVSVDDQYTSWYSIFPPVSCSPLFAVSCGKLPFCYHWEIYHCIQSSYVMFYAWSDVCLSLGRFVQELAVDGWKLMNYNRVCWICSPKSNEIRWQSKCKRNIVFQLYSIECPWSAFYMTIHVDAATVTILVESSLVTMKSLHHVSQCNFCLTIWTKKEYPSSLEELGNQTFTSTLLISRHTPCSNASQKTNWIMGFRPKRWERRMSSSCNEERLHKKSCSDLRDGLSMEDHAIDCCNWKICTFGQESEWRCFIERFPNFNVVHAGRSTCSLSIPDWFKVESGFLSWNSLRALNVLLCIQENVE